MAFADSDRDAYRDAYGDRDAYVDLNGILADVHIDS